METREAITLGGQAQQRLWVLNHVLTGELTATEAAAYLHLSVRSLRRLLARYHKGKGRVERLWGTAQDRLVVELRPAGAATLEETNAVLEARSLITTRASRP